MIAARSLRIVYLARLREDLGRGEEALELPAGVTTVGALREHLAERGEAWRSALGGARALRAAVNHELADAATVIGAGDEVAFFPPVTGG